MCKLILQPVGFCFFANRFCRHLVFRQQLEYFTIYLSAEILPFMGLTSLARTRALCLSGEWSEAKLQQHTSFPPSSRTRQSGSLTFIYLHRPPRAPLRASFKYPPVLSFSPVEDNHVICEATWSQRQHGILLRLFKHTHTYSGGYSELWLLFEKKCIAILLLH